MGRHPVQGVTAFVLQSHWGRIRNQDEERFSSSRPADVFARKLPR
jgi:hypothetical protein